MRLIKLFATVLCLIGSAYAAESTTIAQWLSQQLGHPVEASEILLAPSRTTLNGCTVARQQRTLTRATSLYLRCPAPALPQLVLLRTQLNTPADLHLLTTAGAARALTAATGHIAPLVHSGDLMQAEWSTAFIHAQLPVVAIQSGASGDEIRVRVSHSNRILRARIISAHAVAIVPAGA